MKPGIVRLLAIVAWLFALSAHPAWGDTAPREGVPLAQDLQHDGQLAKEKNGVVLVLFSGEYCGYCKRVLNEFLIPMSRNPEYQAKLVMRRVDNMGFDTMKNFDGTVEEQSKFTSDHGVHLVPTVMLFDRHGHRLAKPLVGLTTVDYYGYFLDKAIDEALAKVRGEAAP